MMRYTLIEIFTSEGVQYDGKPAQSAVLSYISGLKIAARCLVIKGVEGCYEDGEIATPRIEVLSFKMPLKIEIVLPASEAERVLPRLQEMVVDGVVAARELGVVSHRANKRLIPRHLRVRDIMTSSVVKARAETPVGEIMKLLLFAKFHGLPIVDGEDKPIGIVTQGDLVSRAGMPLRLGLIERMGGERIGEVTKALDARAASEIMTKPVTTAREDSLVTEAVDLMLEKNLKRLPVVSGDGRLAGMLSRLDVFNTITRDAPRWDALKENHVGIGGMRPVREIVPRDSHKVGPDAKLEEVLQAIDRNEVQRIAVVDPAGKLLGVIFDHDLLGLFSSHQAGLWDKIASRLTFTEMGRRHKEIIQRAGKNKAADLMKTDLVTISENATIDEAIALMTEKGLKRLPVVDEAGGFKGMIGRESLLRAGMM